MKTSYFSRQIQLGSKTIAVHLPSYFIAEIGANFDGNIEKAKRLALAAKEAGADAAKFQSFLASKIVSDKGFSQMRLQGVHSTWGRPVKEVFQDAEFPRAWHKELYEYCNKIGIAFSSSPYDREAVDLLDDLGVDFIKIGSGDITWHEQLEYIAKKMKPLILATGASTLAEIDEALRIIRGAGNTNVILLQCITNYPSKIESANINVLKSYQTAFDGIITGYSDHSPGSVVVLGSVALGGRVFEKHFTLDKKAAGPDHPHSMEPHEFKKMIDDVRLLEAAMGNSVKNVVEEEAETVIVQRRSLYAAQDIPSGTLLDLSNIVELRPALGILPKYKKDVIGKKLKRTLAAGEPITWNDIE